MDLVRQVGRCPSSNLSSAGSSAQSAESASLRRRTFNALNLYQPSGNGGASAQGPSQSWQSGAAQGFIERVSTGLLNVRDFDSNDGAMFLEVARRCL